MEQALDFYGKREEEITPEVMRQVEGQIMLRILDQRWRDHLYSMDYLKEGQAITWPTPSGFIVEQNYFIKDFNSSKLFGLLIVSVMNLSTFAEGCFNVPNNQSQNIVYNPKLYQLNTW